MSSNAIIWHYPRCSKSRKTLQILEEEGVEVTIRRYLEDPPDAQTLAETIDRLDIAPHQLVRTKESLYGDLDIEEETMTDEQWVELMVNHPKLIQRPVVICDTGAVVGRPPERVHELLSETK